MNLIKLLEPQLHENKKKKINFTIKALSLLVFSEAFNTNTFLFSSYIS